MRICIFTGIDRSVHADHFCSHHADGFRSGNWKFILLFQFELQRQRTKAIEQKKCLRFRSGFCLQKKLLGPTFNFDCKRPSDFKLNRNAGNPFGKQDQKQFDSGAFKPVHFK